MLRILRYACRYACSFFPGFRSESVIGPTASANSSLVVLANGPGLKSYLESVAAPESGADYMCVNLFALNESFEFFQPSHYVVFDPYFFVDLDKADALGTRVFTAISKKTQWPLTLYIPLRFKGFKAKLEALLSSPLLSIVFFRDAGFSLHANAFTLPLMISQLVIPRPQNVLVAALYIALMRRYKTVYLEGADHSWHKYLYLDGDNHLMLQDVHFYDENPKLSPFFKDPVRKVYFSMEEIFLAFHRVHKSYGALRRVAEVMKIRIVNRTPDSFIDCFEKTTRDV